MASSVALSRALPVIAPAREFFMASGACCGGFSRADGFPAA